jgi:fatty-acyl-CoA synthase
MTLAGDKFTFTSLVPTHYIMMLGPPEAAKHRHNAESVAKLLISSAPAHKDTKLALMEYFSRSKLYARPEAGWVNFAPPRGATDQARLYRPRMPRYGENQAP